MTTYVKSWYAWGGILLHMRTRNYIMIVRDKTLVSHCDFTFFLFQLMNRGTKLCLCKVKDAIVWITRLEKSSQIFSSYSFKIRIISFILDHLSSYQRELTLYGDHMIMSHDHVSPEKERNKVGWSCTCHAFNNWASNTLLDKHMQRRIVT